jgi:hypothetical protein
MLILTPVHPFADLSAFLHVAVNAVLAGQNTLPLGHMDQQGCETDTERHAGMNLAVPSVRDSDVSCHKGGSTSAPDLLLPRRSLN